jgi:hypothetical protein
MVVATAADTRRNSSHDGDLKLALNHLVDLFLRMEVLVNGRATLEVVMRECHAAKWK